jgi:dipeptidase E
MAHLLLISNSTVHGSGYLDHVETEIRDFLKDARRIAFVPLALYDRNQYATQARERFRSMGYDLMSIHDVSHPQRAIKEADAVFVGGGNTFRLLKGLYDWDLREVILHAVKDGKPYVGSSAGSIVACPSLKTTKDMPIVQPPSFEALGLVHFQISPHYLDPDPSSTHMGETQEQRILHLRGERSTCRRTARRGNSARGKRVHHIEGSSAGARVFRRKEKPLEVPTGANLDSLLAIPLVEVGA